MSRKIALASLVLLILTLGAPAPGPGPQHVLAADAETLEAWLADAIRFRREQGFVDDPVYVESLLTATDDPREQEFGTPLTDAETALMYRRGEIEVELQGIRDYGDLHARDWGGIWLTPPQDATLSRALTVNVNLVDNKAQHEAAATALAPSGVELVFHEATWSEVQLTAAHEPLRAEAFTVIPTLGTRLNAVETNIVANTLDVYVSSLTPAVEAAIKARYGGDMVRVLEGGESYDDACTRLDCGPPWKGGVKDRAGQ